MALDILRCRLEDIASMRSNFLTEMNAQFIHDKCHLYGWSDDYQIVINGMAIGYGCVWGIDQRIDRDTIFEVYLLPEYRHLQGRAVQELIRQSGATKLECQTNDPNTSGALFEFARNIAAQAILFRDALTTTHSLSNLILNDTTLTDDAHRERVLELRNDGDLVASGGLMLNYNPPYADVFVEVPEKHRRQGYGSLMVQESKRVAYQIGRVPSARCNITNLTSKAMLLQAGFQICGYWLVGDVYSSIAK